LSPLLPLSRAVEQLGDARLLRVLALSLLLAAAAFLGCFFLGAWLLHAVIGRQTWWPAGLLGAVGAALLAFFLYVPVAAGIAALFADSIAAAVERRWYPGLPRPQGAALAVQAWDGVALGLRVLLAQVAALVFALLLPGIGLPLGWAISAWSLGRGLYVMVAMRRRPREAAIAEYARCRGLVLLQGAALTALSLLPVVNLLVPVLGIAAMVHVASTRQSNEI
jgi:CysZ protein